RRVVSVAATAAHRAVRSPLECGLGPSLLWSIYPWHSPTDGTPYCQHEDGVVTFSTHRIVSTSFAAADGRYSANSMGGRINDKAGKPLLTATIVLAFAACRTPAPRPELPLQSAPAFS